MAKKKAEASKSEATPTKAAAPKKKAAPKKATAAPAPEAATKAAAPKKKAAEPKAPGTTPTKAAAPKAAPVKLNDTQLAFLKKIKEAGEGGYHVDKKVEQRTIDALHTRKLLKKGAKDKVKGTSPYTVSKAGDKHIS